MTGEASADAIAALQNRGFKTRTSLQPDSTIAPDHVINTEPAADTAVAAGDDITINVSTGPEQRGSPRRRTLPAHATRKLLDAGFVRVQPSESESTPELKGKVLGTNPPSRRPAITNVITIIVGTGPGSVVVPDCVGQSVDTCKQILEASGFPSPAPVEVDSTAPAGQVTGLNPPAGQPAPKDAVVQMQVSRGNQFLMPNLSGQFWVDAEPNLRALGWTGVLIKGANVDTGQRTNAVVTQSPSPGSGVGYRDSITISFAS